MPATLPRGTAPAMADVDGDGDLDVVCSSLAGASALLRNDGTGNFSDASSLLPSTRIGYTTALAGDFDGDGFDDVAQRWFNGSIDITWGGSGGLQLLSDVAIATGRLLAADPDGDGDTDFVLERADGFDMLRHDPARQLTEVPGVHNIGRLFAANIADLNQDGRDDLLLTRELRTTEVLVVHGLDLIVADPMLQAGFPLLEGWTGRRFAPLVGDVNGDGRPDVMFWNHSGIEQHLAVGAGRFERRFLSQPRAASSFQQAHLRDLDGDGDLDIVLAANEQLTTWHNDGQGRFVQALAYAAATVVPSTVALADFDGDGDVDLVRASLDGLDRFTNGGSGDFGGPTSLLAGPLSVRPLLTAADLDADGDLDLITNLQGAPGMHLVFANDGTGSLVATSQIQVPWIQPPGPIAVGDLDGDGFLDLMVGYGHTQMLRRFVGAGTGVFSEAAMPRLGGAVTSNGLVLTDLDADGDLDLVVPTDGGGNQPLLLLNDSVGGFSFGNPARWGLPLMRPQVFTTVADIDGDGDPDVLLGGELSGTTVAVNHTRQLASRSEPHIGSAIVLDSFTNPGFGSPGISLLLASFAPATGGPSTLPGIDGKFELDAGLSTTLSVLVGTPAGTATTSLSIPNLAGLAGLPVWFQLLTLPVGQVRPGLSNAVLERVLP